MPQTRLSSHEFLGITGWMSVLTRIQAIRSHWSVRIVQKYFVMRLRGA